MLTHFWLLRKYNPGFANTALGATVKPRLTATSVMRSPRYYGHFFWPPVKNQHAFSCQKTLVNTVTPLIRPNVLGPLVTVLTGFRCMSLYSSGYETILQEGLGDIIVQAPFLIPPCFLRATSLSVPIITLRCYPL